MKHANTKHPARHSMGAVHDGGFDRKGQHKTPSSKAIFAPPKKMVKRAHKQGHKNFAKG